MSELGGRSPVERQTVQVGHTVLCVFLRNETSELGVYKGPKHPGDGGGTAFWPPKNYRAVEEKQKRVN